MRSEKQIFAARENGFKKTLVAFIKNENGRAAIIAQLNYLKANPGARLPKPYFNHAETVRIIEEALQMA